MLCTTCVYHNRCALYNATKEYNCEFYKPNCINCIYNTVVNESIETRVREGKRIVTKKVPTPVHYCSRLTERFKIDTTDFCSKGKKKI